MLPCTAAKKAWIVSELNPILEEVVAETIKATPDDPVAFMLALMEKRKAAEEDAVLSAEDWVRLQEENENLKKAVKKLRAEAQSSAAKLAEEMSDKDSDEESSLDEPPPGFIDNDDAPPPSAAMMRTSVSAEVYDAMEAKKSFVPPHYPKTEDQRKRLEQTLMKSFLFSNLDGSDQTIVVDAMKEVVVKSKERIIQQGSNGDCLFVIESGKFECLVAKQGVEKVVKTVMPGDVFGELALLYKCPRAASVEAVENSTVWRLDRDTFNAIVKVSAQKKRQRYDNFLAKVPLLDSMDAYERSQLADALQLKIFTPGTDIVQQGETGDKFYIVETGEASFSLLGTSLARTSASWR
eukprot:TRINITY_DN6811_c0_g1_i2.p1 TRINITY_DN6811_c0_g1~~TRINITY_DN6811_c0_g1_i2.p1  ORF type:complete len:351 (+),score=126.96 TRINITY_DN6811_c0_g1_i2:86-1138(+)